MVEISIIVPVYNGGAYIENTINSILKQQCELYELIIINDGSTDDSLEKINKFKCDNRVTIIEQDNMGICAARNAGILKAKGKYLMFCDHDDLYLDGYIETAYIDITSCNYDFVKYGCKEIWIEDENIVREHNCSLQDKIYSKNEIKKVLLDYSANNEYIWDGIYKREKIIEVGMFDTNFKSGCEDIDIWFKLINVSSMCKISSSIFYEHYIRKSSTSRSYSENSYEAVLSIFITRVAIISNIDDNVIRYIQDKAVQLLWTILGMFSFNTCTLSLKEMCKRLKAMNNIPFFSENLVISNNSFCKKIIIVLYKIKCYFLLALICKFKRKRTMG